MFVLWSSSNCKEINYRGLIKGGDQITFAYLKGLTPWYGDSYTYVERMKVDANPIRYSFDVKCCLHTITCALVVWTCAFNYNNNNNVIFRQGIVIVDEWILPILAPFLLVQYGKWRQTIDEFYYVFCERVFASYKSRLTLLAQWKLFIIGFPMPHSHYNKERRM